MVIVGRGLAHLYEEYNRPNGLSVEKATFTFTFNITCIVIGVANVKTRVRKTLELRLATRSTLQRVHKYIEVGGGMFENLL